MLRNLDTAASDALCSFSEALTQAQQTLQNDQTRLDTTAALLQKLSDDNTQMRVHKVHNSQEQQRLDALRTEKAKLTRQVNHKRDHAQVCLQQIQKLKEPRLQLLETLERQRTEVKALRKDYAIRAAQIYAYVRQFLHPQNSLAALQGQLIQLQKKRAEAEDVNVQLSNRIKELELEMTELTNKNTARCEAERLDNEEESEADASAHTKTEAKPGLRNKSLNMAEEERCTEEEDGLCDNNTHPPLTEAQLVQRMTVQRAQQRESQALMQLQFEQKESSLQQQRAELKEQVLELCRTIEEADAAQQSEQRSYNEELNAAAAASAGSSRVCVHCHHDLLRDF